MKPAIFPRFRLRERCVAALAGAFLSALVASPALAQTKGSWNVDADGLWSVSSNWLNNTIAGGVSGSATFANNITATRTVTLDTARSIGGFVFGDADTASAASWIVTGSTMTMNNGVNSPTITVNALGTGATATIANVLASSTSPAIIKNGAGTLVLSASNTFTKLSIEAGTLQVSTDRNLGAVPGSFAADQLQISNNAILRTSTSFTMAANRGITIGSGGGTLNLTGGMLTSQARITGAGNLLSVTGSRDLTLQNTSGTASSVNWDFQQTNANRVFFQGVNALGSGTVRVRSGVKLVQTSTASGTGSITNAVTLDSGAGLNARVSSVFTNVIFPSSGTVQFNVDDQATSTLTITSGGSLSGNLVVSTQQGGTNAVGQVNLDGAFSGAGGFVKTGTGASGLVQFRGAHTYTGTTSINSGSLRLGGGGTVGSLSPASVITGSAGGTFIFNRSNTISSGSQFGSIGGAINVTQAGSGTTVFAGVNTYTGTTSITNGTLQLGSAGSIANSVAIVLSATSTTFDVSAVAGGFSLGAGQVLQGVGTVVGDVTALGTIAPGSSPGTLTFANDLSLGSASILSYELSGTDTTVGSGINDLSSVLGDLSLNGTLNVTETVAGSFLSANAGDSWRLFNYTGTLTGSGLSLGAMPALAAGNSFQIDTSVANQVNVVVVPEPAAIATVAVGLGLLGVAGARRRLRRLGR
jgi:fibronectin-binding autotransporter adhesin